MNLVILYALNHKPQSACRAFEQAARTYEHMGNGRGQALVLSNSAWLRHSVLGEDTGAETDAQHALRVYREMGDARGQAQCLGVLGSVSYRRGESTEAVALLQESLALAREADDSWIEAQVLAEWARCELEAGLADSGLVHADCALGLCLRLDMRDLAVSVNALRGRLLVGLQRPEEAMAATTAALRGSRPGANPPYSVTFAHSLALAASHRQAEADRYLQIAHRQVLALLSDLPDGRRDTAVASVPAHRAVIDAWSARRPEQTQYSLARVGAPTGRPLAENERTAVSWTIHAPDDLAIRDDSCRRRQRLLRLIAEAEVQGGTPTIAELADALRTSVVTVRRDLAFLRQQGLAVRTRGTRGHHTRQR
jgi:tetratricopeptide (TPR) repeat protein